MEEQGRRFSQIIEATGKGKCSLRTCSFEEQRNFLRLFDRYSEDLMKIKKIDTFSHTFFMFPVPEFHEKNSVCNDLRIFLLDILEIALARERCKRLSLHPAGTSEISFQRWFALLTSYHHEHYRTGHFVTNKNCFVLA